MSQFAVRSYHVNGVSFISTGGGPLRRVDNPPLPPETVVFIRSLSPFSMTVYKVVVGEHGRGRVDFRNDGGGWYPTEENPLMVDTGRLYGLYYAPPHLSHMAAHEVDTILLPPNPSRNTPLADATARYRYSPTTDDQRAHRIRVDSYSSVIQLIVPGTGELT